MTPYERLKYITETLTPRREGFDVMTARLMDDDHPLTKEEMFEIHDTLSRLICQHDLVVDALDALHNTPSPIIMMAPRS